MNPIRTLERQAIDAFRLSWTWDQFWRLRGDAIREAEPYHASRYRKLVNRLLSLVASGDTANIEPLDAPWLDDDLPDQPSPHDSKTAAKCLLPLVAIPGATTADRLEQTR
jgi:hypothetical protein